MERKLSTYIDDICLCVEVIQVDPEGEEVVLPQQPPNGAKLRLQVEPIHNKSSDMSMEV